MQQLNRVPKASKRGKKKIFDYLGWSIWAGLLLIFGQSAFESLYENETRAAMIYGAATGLFLMGGLIIYFSRKYSDL